MTYPDQRSREFLADMLWGTAHSANIASMFLEANDVAGLEYAMRRTAAYLRQAVTALNLLKVPPQAQEASDARG
jgi:hypothetical protein